MSLLPSAKTYEVSYMHRDVVIAAITTKTFFIITASSDGHVKFWKKAPEGGLNKASRFNSWFCYIQQECAQVLNNSILVEVSL